MKPATMALALKLASTSVQSTASGCVRATAGSSAAIMIQIPAWNGVRLPNAAGTRLATTGLALIPARTNALWDSTSVPALRAKPAFKAANAPLGEAGKTAMRNAIVAATGFAIPTAAKQIQIAPKTAAAIFL
jgi:hypothetical protein